MRSCQTTFSPSEDYFCEQDFLIQVLAGEHDLLDQNDHATRHSVARINNHPRYKCVDQPTPKDNDYDYSILELSERIDLSVSSKARAACLPSPKDTSNTFNSNTR